MKNEHICSPEYPLSDGEAGVESGVGLPQHSITLYGRPQADSPISIIDDHFSRTSLRCFDSERALLSVVEFPVRHARNPDKGMFESGRSVGRVRILRATTINEVRELVRRSKEPSRAIRNGHWYEVMSD